MSSSAASSAKAGADSAAAPNDETALYRTDLPLPNRRQGKVRDVYDLPAARPGETPRLLIVATDRLSAYDVVMPTPFLGKGRLLTEISRRWFEWIGRELPGIPHHVLSTDHREVPVAPELQRPLEGRVMICRRSQVVPIECVARGYLAGSGWKEYRETGMVCGIALPKGLRQCERLPEPIFTPATKAAVGHDENIPFERACRIAGEELMERLRSWTLDLYRRAHDYAQNRGILIADTKFEFGLALDGAGKATDRLLLIDEVLTPDSSRFWPMDRYAPGRDQESFDKQYLRNYLETLVAAGTWQKSPPGPQIPADVVASTMARYREARDRLFG